MGARGRLVRHRVEPDYRVQVSAAAISARCIQQSACGGFRLARCGCDPVWGNLQVEHPRLRCRPRRSAVLLRVYDRHGRWRVHQLPNPAQFRVPQQGQSGQADRVVCVGILRHHLHRQLHQLRVGRRSRIACAGLYL